MPSDYPPKLDWQNNKELCLLMDVLSERLHQLCNAEGVAPIDKLVSESPSKYQECVFIELIVEEVRLRRKRSQPAEIEQYRLRFPDKVDLIEVAWRELQQSEASPDESSRDHADDCGKDTEVHNGESTSDVYTKFDTIEPTYNRSEPTKQEDYKELFLQATEELFDSICQQFGAASSQGIQVDKHEYVKGVPEPLKAILLEHLGQIELNFSDVPGDQLTGLEYTESLPNYATVVEGQDAKRNVNPPHRPTDNYPVTNLPRRFADFELLEEIGKGGMGVVYKAQDENLKRIVAVKLIRPELLLSFSNDDRLDLVTRFRNEVQAAAQLEHDHVLRIYQIGDWQGQLYYAMQFVRGENLRDKLENGPLQPDLAARYMAQTADALAAAHAKGILHRDLKPHNVMVEDKLDRALLADFGLAKLTKVDQQLTASAAILGSPPYMSPEQTVDASKVTEASDIYGLGATLYHLLTGRPPFQAATPTATMLQVQTTEPVAPRLLNAAIPRDLETICLKCLSKRTGDRYLTASEVCDELNRYLAAEPIRAKPPTPFQLFLRWYPKHGTTMLGAYFIVTPMTWVFYILGGLLQSPSGTGLRLSSPAFLPWACLWIYLGYMIVKRGLWFEILNIPVLFAFAIMPFWLNDEPQALVLISSISLLGILLQIAAMVCRFNQNRTRVGQPRSVL